MAKRKKTEVMEWLDSVMVDPETARAVEERMAEMRIEQELVALREKTGLSQRDLAERIGASQPYIAKVESGRVKNLGLKTLVKYAAATGTRLTVRFEPMPRPRKAAARPVAVATIRARRAATRAERRSG
ncbi:MAG: helix-turn-helix transcriptional regulator [Deltaproteobacteria bacterium]|nr:helix-turn-helix transcriptional regulator [Deltaproteobacteria bacterium]